MIQLVNGKIARVYEPADAVELMRLITEANDRKKKYIMNADKGTFIIDEGSIVSAELLPYFEELQNRITELEGQLSQRPSARRTRGTGEGKGRNAPRGPEQLTPEQTKVKKRFMDITESIDAGKEKEISNEDIKFFLGLADRANAARVWKPKRWSVKVQSWLDTHHKAVRGETGKK